MVADAWAWKVAHPNGYADAGTNGTGPMPASAEVPAADQPVAAQSAQRP